MKVLIREETAVNCYALSIDKGFFECFNPYLREFYNVPDDFIVTEGMVVDAWSNHGHNSNDTMVSAKAGNYEIGLSKIIYDYLVDDIVDYSRLVDSEVIETVDSIEEN